MHSLGFGFDDCGSVVKVVNVRRSRGVSSSKADVERTVLCQKRRHFWHPDSTVDVEECC